MRRIKYTLLSLSIIIAATAINVAAANTWVDIHGISKNAGGIGLSKQLTGNLWGGVRMDGLGSQDVKTSADVIYKVPKQLWLWEPYAGGGIDYNMSTGESGSHVVVGSKILWFFAEQEFRLVNRGSTTRGGIRIAF